MTRVRWSAVGHGMVVAAVVAVPAGIVAQLLPTGTGWAFVLFLVIVGALVAGGYVAGRAGPELALTHGALAGAATYLAIQAVGVVARLARGDTVSWASIPFIAMLSTGCGILGGFLADQAARRSSMPAPDTHATEEGDS